MAHDSGETSAATPLSRFALLRFTLRQFLIGVAGIALACVALRSASTWWVSAMMGLAFFAMTAALLLVVYRRDSQRAYWVGFATFGWVYLLLFMFGWIVEKNTPLRPSAMFTDRISRASYDWLFAKATAQSMTGYGSGMYGGYGGYSSSNSVGMDSGMGGGDMGSGYGWSIPPVPGDPGYVAPTQTVFFAPPSKDHFVNVAHGIWAILLAACGGWLALLIYVTQPRQSPAAST